jgi:glycosyltransferase involved in cell wall biosynthesis
MSSGIYSRNLPLVTVGVPVYNGAEHLRHTLDSLLEQDYPRMEILISDNASTDDTAEIAREYVRTYPNIIYHRHPENLGSAVNFTTLTEMARGKYFMWAATHDKWTSSIVSRAVDVMERDQNVHVCYAVPYWLMADGTEVPIDTTLIDTRSSTKVARFVITIWSLTACPQIYGVHRLSSIRQMMPCRKMFGPDTYIIARLACKGAFAVLHDQKFFLRQLGDFNDWSSYFRKLDLQVNSNSSRELYHDFIKAHLRLVWDEFPSWTERIPLAIIVLFCMLKKYNWVPEKIGEACRKQGIAVQAQATETRRETAKV